jgi:hypothetical protein
MSRTDVIETKYRVLLLKNWSLKGDIVQAMLADIPGYYVYLHFLGIFFVCATVGDDDGYARPGVSPGRRRRHRPQM